jgi:hypothetical protein
MATPQLDENSEAFGLPLACEEAIILVKHPCDLLKGDFESVSNPTVAASPRIVANLTKSIHRSTTFSANPVIRQ